MDDGGQLEAQNLEGETHGSEAARHEARTAEANMAVATIQESERMSEARRSSAPRRALRRDEAAQYLAVSPTKFAELVRDGRMPPPIRLDGCAIWDIRDLDAAFDVLKDAHGRNVWDEAAA
jgi:predicted DNA-binding transcriptional regulator AlpA